MKHIINIRALVPVLMATILVAALPGVAANDFDPDKFLQNKAFKKDLEKIETDDMAQRSIMNHANASFGISKTIFDFAAEVAGGQYTEQLEIIMDTPVQQWNPARGMQGSYEIINVKRIARQNQSVSIFGRVKDDMGNLATALSILSVAKDSYAAFNGDDSAKLKAIKTTYDTVSGYWATRVGWNSLSTAMIGVGFMGYALDTFVATAMTQYSDAWWGQYSLYLDKKYPNMVTGPNSWAALAQNGGNAAVHARLNEFWANWDENLTGTSLSKPAMAQMQMGNQFAARYYSEYVHTTLKTFYKMQAEEAEALAWYKAQKAHEHMLKVVRDLEALRLAIQDADSIEEEEEEDDVEPHVLLVRPRAKTIYVDESVTLTTIFYYTNDKTSESVTSKTTFSGASSSPVFTATEAGTFTITATCEGLINDATITVKEKEGTDEEENEIGEVIEEITEPDDVDACLPSVIAGQRGDLESKISRVQSLSAVIANYRTKFDKELADRAADPCGNSLMAYCYTQAATAASDLDYLVDEIRTAATSLIMTMALCPTEVDASGDPLSFADIISDLARAGSARGDAESAMAAMQSRLGENGCDEEAFEDLADQITEDGQDPDELQDGGGMSEVGGDGVDNDQDGLQEEDWAEVSGKTVTIVVYDSGNLKDDVFNLSVSGVGSLGLTPAGGLRTYGLDLAPGTYTATVSVVVAPDNCGTVTALVMENGVEIGALSTGSGCPAVGSALTMSFTVTGQ